MICKRKVPEKKEDEVEVTPTDERKQASRPKTQVFFEVVVFGFCWKCRYLLVLVFLGLAVFFGYYAAQLTPDPNPPVLPPDTDPCLVTSLLDSDKGTCGFELCDAS